MNLSRRQLFLATIPLLLPDAAQAGWFGSSRPHRFTSRDVDFIRVRKDARKLDLVGKDRILKEYDIRLGSNPVGPKRFLRDGRTPEGLYRILRRNAQSRFHRSLGLDYPNVRDRAYAASHGRSPGGDIFIHGQPNGYGGTLSYDWTWGCIALSNADMDEVWALAPQGCKVIIEA